MMSHRIPPNYRPSEPEPPASIATLRLIVTALVIGACVLGGTVAFSASRIGAKVINEPVIVYAVAGVSVFAAMAAMAVPMVLKPQPGLGESKQIQRYGAMTLLRIGLLEGSAVMNYIVYLLSQNEITLGVGIAIVALMLLLRPNEAKYTAWKGTPPDGDTSG
jgi:hypothetical protein